jgi:hypothetical protein
VLRSTGSGTMRVHQRLNERRAMTLCCTANRPSSSRLTISASASGAGAPLSIDLGTATLPTKPIA